jgi:hypothetical protein
MSQTLIRNKDFPMSNALIKFISLNATAAMIAASEASGSACYTVRAHIGGAFYETCHNYAFGDAMVGDFETNEILVEPISKKEEAVFKSLNDAWGDDEDGEYENLYKHHTAIKSHAL